MGFIENSAFNMQKKQLDAANLTNELLTSLLAEVKNTNDLTRWMIDQKILAPQK